MSDLPLSTGEIQERLGQSAFIELLNLTVLSGRSLMGTIARTRTTTSPAPGTGSGKSVS